MEHPPEVQEIDVTAADTPEHLRGWGSPTILIDGVDVAGGRPSGSSCRLYPGSDRPGVPSLDTLRAALATREKEGSPISSSALPGRSMPG